MRRQVFISGASSGIGLATAQRLSTEGWHVLAGHLPGDDLAALHQAGIDAADCIAFDLADPEQVQAAAERISELAGEHGLNALVLSAGVHLPGPLEALPPDVLQRQFGINVFGHHELIQGLLPLMRQSGGGRLVILSSLMGRVAMPALGAYSMSKHALEAMADVLRIELNPDQITVSLIEPGAVSTPMTASMGDLIERARQQIDPALKPRYARLLDQMSQALVKQEAQAVPVSAVVDAIMRALNDNKPRSRYAVGTAASGLMLMRRLAPDTVADWILQRALGLEQKQ